MCVMYVCMYVCIFVCDVCMCTCVCMLLRVYVSHTQVFLNPSLSILALTRTPRSHPFHLLEVVLHFPFNPREFPHVRMGDDPELIAYAHVWREMCERTNARLHTHTPTLI